MLCAKQALEAVLSKPVKPPFITKGFSLTVTGFAFVPGSEVYYTGLVYELPGFSFTPLNGLHCVLDVLRCLQSLPYK